MATFVPFNLKAEKQTFLELFQKYGGEFPIYAEYDYSKIDVILEMIEKYNYTSKKLKIICLLNLNLELETMKKESNYSLNYFSQSLRELEEKLLAEEIDLYALKNIDDCKKQIERKKVLISVIEKIQEEFSLDMLETTN